MLTINLPDEIESRLKGEAVRQGLDPVEFAKVLIDRALPKPDQASLDVLAEWERENQTNDPQELARRQAEGEEFMRNLARNRSDAEGASARKLWP